MVIFEGLPYPLDILYIKMAGKKEVLSMPLVEALAILTNVVFDTRASSAKSKEAAEPYFVLKGDAGKEKSKTYTVSKTELIKRLQSDIYEDTEKISDLVIQPQDELLTNEVKIFINQL